MSRPHGRPKKRHHGEHVVSKSSRVGWRRFILCKNPAWITQIAKLDRKAQSIVVAAMLAQDVLDGLLYRSSG
jgi:hypothetical protein